MKNERLQRVFLIIAVFMIAQALIGFFLNALLVPYDGTMVDARPSEGWVRSMNDFFEVQGEPLISIVSLIISFYLSYWLDKKLHPEVV